MDKKALNRKPGLLSLQTKLAIAFAVIALLSSGIVTAFVYLRVRTQLFEDVRRQLGDSVSIGALYVDGDAHASLTDPAQQDSAAYSAMQRTFREIREAGTDFIYVYSFRVIDGEVYFVVDADEEEPAALGEEYTELLPGVPEKLASLRGPYVDENFTTDEYGTVLTGYAPIFKSDGTLDAVLGIDIAASDIIAYQNNFLWMMLPIFVLTTLVIAAVGWFIGRQMTAPILTLIESARRIEAGDLDYKVRIRARDETAILAGAFNSMSAQLRDLINGLERRVAERTWEVDQRSKYMSAAAEVSKVATTIREPGELIRRVVDLIRDSFGLYYVGLFLVDEKKEYAILRAGTGDAGRLLVERGHRIQVGEGMIGWCIEHSQSRVALEVGSDSIRLASPLLPATRSEAALPLRSRGQVVGALTVQSDQEGAFNDAIVTVLQTMVDQVGIALDNAHLFVENEQALRNIRRSVADINRQAWQDTLQSRAILGYRGDATGIQPIDTTQTGILDKPEKKQTERSITGNVQIPLKVRDQVLGIVEASRSQSGREWSKEEINLMNTLVEQIGIAIENARLFEESRRKAERERILSEITGRVRSSTDINIILQTAVQDLAEALHVPKGAIRLIKPEAQSDDAGPNILPISQPPGNGGTSNE
jgi:GAF domain-containing protein/HAMP domain-containing protein